MLTCSRRSEPLIAAVLAAVALLPPAPSAAAAGCFDRVQAIEGVTTWSGRQHGPPDHGALAVRSQGDWETLWRLVGGRGRAPGAPAELPEGKVGVAVFLGQRASEGFDAALVDCRGQRDRLVVAWRELGPSGPAATVITRPWRVWLIDAPDLPVAPRQVR